MIVSEFYSLVSGALRRGTTLDAVIPNYAKLATQWMERNYTFKYMENFRLFQIASGERVLDLPTNTLIKAWKFVRLVDSDGKYAYLNKVEPEDLKSIRTASSANSSVAPENYWIAGTKTLVFDAVPSANLEGEALYYNYSDWPTGQTETHPLLQFAADVLQKQCLLELAVYLRDQRLIQEYVAIRNEALNTLTRAEDENQYGGESITMAYKPR